MAKSCLNSFVEIRKGEKGERDGKKVEKRFEYELLVDGKVVWMGLNQFFGELRAKYPDKKVGMARVPEKGVLIA